MQPVQVWRTTVCMLSEEALHVRASHNSIACCRNLVVRRGVRSRQAASIGCPQALLDGDLPFRQPQDCLPRGDASVSRSQTCFGRNLLSQDDQKGVKEGDVCSKRYVFNRVDYFQADQARLPLATVIVSLSTCGCFFNQVRVGLILDLSWSVMRLRNQQPHRIFRICTTLV